MSNPSSNAALVFFIIMFFKKKKIIKPNWVKNNYIEKIPIF